MPRVRKPKLPITAVLRGGKAILLKSLTMAEVAEVEAALAMVKARRCKLKHWRRRKMHPVPPKLWGRLAILMAEHHDISARALLYGGNEMKYTVPRMLFWRVLRAFQKNGKPRYSLTAIAAITGHDHSTVVSAMTSKTPSRDYPKLWSRGRFGKSRRSLVGEIFGQLTIMGKADRPEGKTHYRWWRCRCSCGVEVVTSTGYLAGGKTVCGAGHRAESRTVNQQLLRRAVTRGQLAPPA